jgi:uncharacterized protein YgbK (DUF1537 family)
MMQNIAVIGSDINGVITTVSQFANCGARVTLYLGDTDVGDCDVVGFTTNSKHLSARHAYGKTRDAIRRCQGRHIYTQEDSSLKGNLPANIQAAIDELNPRKILICLSSPEKRRHVQGGVVHIEGVPADQTALYNDPLSPVKEAHIPTLLYKNIGIKSKVLGFDIIDKGPETILRHIMDSSERIIVLDALEPQHFRNIAEAIQLGGDECFACIANNLCGELPFSHGYSRENVKAIESLENNKPVLVVIGSYDPIAGMQLRKASEENGLPVISLKTTGLLSLKERESRIREYCDEVMATLKTGNNCAITSNSSKFIPQLKYKMAYLLAEIAAEVLQHCDLGALLNSGSDTNYAVCDILQVKKIEILGSIRTNTSTTISRLHMGNGKLLYIGSRGGAVGGPDEISKTLQILRPLQSTK